MPDSRFRVRAAESADAPGIAVLHAASWRRIYRGVYSDSFLDGDVEGDRERLWALRLKRPGSSSGRTVVAEDAGRLVGFVHTILDEHPTWGALLDNLHLADEYRRQGIGSRLLALSADEAARQGTGLYLWVNRSNVQAQSFYLAHGGSLVEQVLSEAPGGVADRLVGAPVKLRCIWEHSGLPLRDRRS